MVRCSTSFIHLLPVVRVGLPVGLPLAARYSSQPEEHRRRRPTAGARNLRAPAHVNEHGDELSTVK